MLLSLLCVFGWAGAALARGRVCGRAGVGSGAAFSGGSVLLYGPPGTGKTTLARACAHATGATLVELRATDVVHGTGTPEEEEEKEEACFFFNFVTYLSSCCSPSCFLFSLNR